MKDNTFPAAIWHEKENLDGKVVRVFVVVLRTRGCFWAKKSGCLMCGYNSESSDDITDAQIIAQVENALSSYQNEEFVKIYTSGSFFDTAEISTETQEKILERFGERCQRVLVETRPEFAERALQLMHHCQELEVALGMETASQTVLDKCVRKGTTVQQYLNAAEKLRSAGIRVRIYLLLKPPFLTEAEAIEDTLRSIQVAAKYADVISVNPVNVQKGTFLEKMFLRDEYRAPWFWSIFEVLKKARETIRIPVISHPSGSGKKRGIHNCGKCDEHCNNLLKKYNLTQEPDVLSYTCECKSVWEAQKNMENVLRYSPYLAME
ncbi:MAG: archaeosine biosynthesis radical SAM protein RaSEA [Thermoplasmata archaeon]